MQALRFLRGCSCLTVSASSVRALEGFSSLSAANSLILVEATNVVAERRTARRAFETPSIGRDIFAW